MANLVHLSRRSTETTVSVRHISRVTAVDQAPSPRREALLDLAYRYVLEHGLADMSLRPLADAVGSSPRVLLFLFGSKDGLVRALLAKARAEELAQLQIARGQRPVGDLAEFAGRVWAWLAAPEHRPLLILWIEAYGRSLVEPAGPWADFARRTVDDWLDILAELQPPRRRRSRTGAAERTLVLAVLRGALLDLLATSDLDRTTAAVTTGLQAVRAASPADRSTWALTRGRLPAADTPPGSLTSPA
jgi:AcrR family transcriptional regulator